MIPSIDADIDGVEDDEDFGDFVFSFPSSSHAPSLSPYPAPPLHAAITTVDEDWGDFYASPLGSSCPQPHFSSPFSAPFDPFSGVSIHHPSPLGSSQLSGKGWEKPKGAIPLSIFGEEDAEEQVQPEHPGLLGNGFVSYSMSSHSSPRPAPTGKLNDLIESLYGQAGSGKVQEDYFDDGSWEFKDAFSAFNGPQPMDEGAIFGLKVVASANENGRSQFIFVGLEMLMHRKNCYKLFNQSFSC